MPSRRLKRRAAICDNQARSDRIAADDEAVGAERFYGLKQMLTVPGFDDNFKNCAFGRKIGENALMEDLNDVCLSFREDDRDAGELARTVLEIDNQL